MSHPAIFPPPTKPHPVEKEADLTQRARRFGHIVTVTGARAIVALERDTYNPTKPNSDRVSIGMLVAIRTQKSHVIGAVSEMTAAVPSFGGSDDKVRLVEIYLAGEIPLNEENTSPTFRRGISNFPTIGDRVRECTSAEIASAYNHRPGSPTLEIGTLYQASDVPARVVYDEMFSKHFLIVGNTGTGKSCAVRNILGQTIKKHVNSHIVLLDMHNEYGAAFGEKAKKFGPHNLSLPFWLLNFQELCSVLTAEGPDQKTEIDILSEAITVAKRNQISSSLSKLQRLSESLAITVDTPTPYRLSEVISYLNDQMGKLEKAHVTYPYKKIKARIEGLINDPRFGFMFSGITVEDNMAKVLENLFRIPSNGKPISVIDLSQVPHDILDVVISLIARLALDFGVCNQGKLPILLVCEEAHRYAPASDDRGFLPTRTALARIAKEGRKYGVGLGLITQRPSELDSTIISQCSTIISMRLSTHRDQAAIKANTQDGGLEFVDFLPILAEREAIVIGQAAPMPMRVKFSEIENIASEQTSHTTFSDAWDNAALTHEVMEDVVANWRFSGRNIKKTANDLLDGSSVSSLNGALPTSNHNKSSLLKSHAPID